MNENSKYCNQCENRCPADDLKCGKGRAAFGLDPADSHGHEHGGHGQRVPMEGTLGLLQQCGHRLHHGGVGGDALSGLTASEQSELAALLTKLLADWDARFPSQGHGGHERRQR